MSLPFNYDNAFGPSEATLRLGGQNWTVSGIRTLSLFFHGTPGNTGTLYVKIAYDGDADDIAAPAWQPWNIDLSTISGLQNVQSMTIGVDGTNAAGMLYIDDIRLYPLPGAIITPADPGNAHLVAHYTFDGTTVSLYGDGRFVNTATVNNVNTPGAVHVGKRQDNDNYFEGLVDDLRIYDSALTPEEIAWIAGKRTPMHQAL